MKILHILWVTPYFYRQSVDNKVLLSLNTIGTQQAEGTEITNEAIK